MNIRKGRIIDYTYRITDSAINTGASAKVWKAYHFSWEKDIAIKVPRDKVLESKNGRQLFKDECELWTELGLHPHIATCYYMREIDGIPMAVCEWYNNGTLAQHIKSEASRKTILKGDNLICIASQIAMGIKYLHSRCVIHKDIKPANILLTDDWIVKITDFGSAVDSGESPTPMYCSPEQHEFYSNPLINENPITDKTDIYSWAVIVLEMCMEKACWESGPLASKYFYDNIDTLREIIDPSLFWLLEISLNSNPDKRPTAEYIVDYLRDKYSELFSSAPSLCYRDIDCYDYPEYALNNQALYYIDTGDYETAENLLRTASYMNYNDVVINTNYYKLMVFNGKMTIEDANNFFTDPLTTSDCGIFSPAGFPEPESMCKYREFATNVYYLFCTAKYEKNYKNMVLNAATFVDIPGYRYTSLATAFKRFTYLFSRSCGITRNRKETIPGRVKDVFFIKDGAMYAVLTDDKMLKVYNRNGRLVKTLSQNAEKVAVNSYSYIAVTESGGNIVIYEPTLNRKLNQEDYSIESFEKQIEKFFIPKELENYFNDPIVTVSPNYDAVITVNSKGIYTIHYCLITYQLNKDDDMDFALISSYETNKMYPSYLYFDIENCIEEYDEIMESDGSEFDPEPPDDEDLEYLSNYYQSEAQSYDDYYGEDEEELSTEETVEAVRKCFGVKNEIIVKETDLNHKKVTTFNGIYIEGFDSHNAFLIENQGELVFKYIKLLSEVKLVNPSIEFTENSKISSEWAKNHERYDTHPDADIQHLIDMPDDEYNSWYYEYKRISPWWEGADTPVDFLTLYIRSQADAGNESYFNSVHKGLAGFGEGNIHLVDLLENDIHIIKNLADIELINPAVKFRRSVDKIKELQSKTYEEPDTNDSELLKILSCSEEELMETEREINRQAYYWHGEEKQSFMTLFARTLDEKENKNATEYASEEPVLYKEINHNPIYVTRRTDYLPKLTEKIRNMRNELLKNVKGQDHVVHAFCEGIFNSEVLIHADTERVRPRAVFTFAGPPGVGKTYLAELAAKNLGKPFRRFDMTEYSAHNAHLGLIGFESTWKDSTPGNLTMFVRDNPECVLLFDEIEKAHPQVIQVFFQMLDAGVVTDKFFDTKTDENTHEFVDPERGRVSFRDTTIIFTTNVGRSLYEGDYAHNCAGVPRKTLLNALKTEVDPQTKQPFFPSAIVSRIATGYPMMFSNLMPHNLVSILENEFNHITELFEKQYGITLTTDKKTLLALLFAEGGRVDARTLKSRVDLFFKNELYRIFSTGSKTIPEITKYNFVTETKGLPEKIDKLFNERGDTEILLYSSRLFGDVCEKAYGNFVFHTTNNIDEAISMAGKYDIDFVLIDIAQRSVDETAGTEHDNKTMLASMAATNWKDGNLLFSTLRERIPELPIYILQSNVKLYDELIVSFVRSGARGVLKMPDEKEINAFGEQLSEISREIYMQETAEEIAAQHKVLYFETAPRQSKDRITINLRNFKLKPAPDADDINDIIGENEKPAERFKDVFGAHDAKKALEFYVNILKNPKKAAALGNRIPKGVLLYGSPGTGKTMLARAVAGESDVTFIATNASSFVQQYAGTGPAAVRELFRKARRYAPSIIFIDEIDSIGRQRTGDNNNTANDSTLEALLTEMDGFAVDNKRPVFVLAATNYGVKQNDGGIGVLDEALLRRFDRKIKIDPLNTQDRIDFIRMKLEKIPDHKVTDNFIKVIASRSVGISPKIIDDVIEHAKQMVMTADKPAVIDDGVLDEAFQEIKHGNKKEWGAELTERTARHECGHTIISILSGEVPGYLTIESREDFGGYMEHSEEKRTAVMPTRQDIIWLIRTSLGGRAAEIEYYGKENGLSTGVSSDLRNATFNATRMLTTFGMDEEFGLATMEPHEADRNPEVRAKVNKILAEQMAITIDLIKEHKEMLDKLCNALLMKNRLTGNEIREVLADEIDEINKNRMELKV